MKPEYQGLGLGKAIVFEGMKRLKEIEDIINKNAYFMCLNDYIEKVIIPSNPNYIQQKTLVINIPTSNTIKDNKNIIPIRWYAKRAKLFALFSKANYQRSELNYMSDDNLATDILHFANIIRRFDAWSASKYFYALKTVQDELDYFLQSGITKMAEDTINWLRKNGKVVEEKCWETNYSSEELSLIESENATSLRVLWGKICNCGFIIEDLAKEWFLPTYMGLITSDEAR